MLLMKIGVKCVLVCVSGTIGVSPSSTVKWPNSLLLWLKTIEGWKTA